MNVLILAMIVAQTAQPRIPSYTPFYLPETGKDGFCVTLKGGGEVYHGYLIKDETSSGKPLQIDAYFRESGAEQLQPLAVIDAKGQIRGTRKAFGRDQYESAAPEYQQEQQAVIDRYLKQARLTRVSTAHGPLWISQAEADLIDEAEKMAKANTPANENPLKQLLLDDPAVEPGLENAAVSGSGEAPGFFTLWGPEIIIVVGAVVLLAAIGYVTFVRG